MEPHHKTANHSKHSFANHYWLHTRYKHSTPSRQNKVLPTDTHLKLHATQLKQLTQTQTHSLHDLNAYPDPIRNIKATIFHNNEQTNIIISESDIPPEKCGENLLTHLNYHHLTISQF